MSTTLTSPDLQKSPSPLGELHYVPFYGATRFEAPEAGLKFRHNGLILQVLRFETERSGLRDFARRWKFTAECQVLPRWDY